MATDALWARLDRIPRVSLAHLPTPIQPLERLSRAIGGPAIWMVRDDLTGLAFGGNKVRQLEYLLAPAIDEGATVLIAGGGASQSNHARCCAAAARALGLRSVVLVRPDELGARRTGNALLMDLLADEVRVVPELGALSADRLLEIDGRRPIFESVADEWRSDAERPFVLLGSSVPLGAIAYVRAFLEIMDSADREGVTPDVLCVTSMGATHAGLALAARLVGSPCRVIGFAYAPTGGAGPDWVARLANGAASLLDVMDIVEPLDIENDASLSGPRYGIDSPESVAAMGLLAETEGVLLDPVYTAKGMAGMLGQIRHGAIRHSDTVLFIHTGGLPAIFADRGVPTPPGRRVEIDV